MVTQEESSLIVSERILRTGVARTMHKFSTAATQSFGVRCAPPMLHSVDLLNVLQSVRFRGPQSRVGGTRLRVAHPGRRFRHFVTKTYE